MNPKGMHNGIILDMSFIKDNFVISFNFFHSRFEIILDCWEEAYDLRPTFENLMLRIKRLKDGDEVKRFLFILQIHLEIRRRFTSLCHRDISPEILKIDPTSKII